MTLLIFRNESFFESELFWTAGWSGSGGDGVAVVVVVVAVSMIDELRRTLLLLH